MIMVKLRDSQKTNRGTTENNLDKVMNMEWGLVGERDRKEVGVR